MNNLSLRLSTIASLVPKGAFVCDVGTDHGFLPIFLTESEKARGVIATDINEKPLKKAEENLKKWGAEGITLRLCDGLSGVKKGDADTVIIAGMGGELIATILGACDYVKEKHIILNPMTHPELARKWLYDNGFEIINDIIVSDSRHHYSVFDAEYSGTFREYTQTDCFLGKINDYSDKEYFVHLLNYLKNKQKSGADYGAVIQEIETRINNDNG